MVHRRSNNSGFEETGRRTTDLQHQYWLDYFNAGDSWRLFRIMSEFVDGFDTLAGIKGPAVSFFGSARTNPGRFLLPTYSNDCQRTFAAGICHNNGRRAGYNGSCEQRCDGGRR